MGINLEGRVFSKDAEISFYDVDYNKRLKLSCMLKIFAMLAGDDYEERGLGHIFLREHGFAFLVSRAVYKIFRMPVLEDKVTISTWVEGISGAKYLRGYEMKSKSGEMLISGEGVWILVNPETKRIVRPADFPFACGSVDKRAEITSRPIKIADAELIGEHTVLYSDVDYNGHLNNTTYGDVIANALPKEDICRDIDTFSLCYSHEAKLGDTVSLFRRDDQNACLIAGRVGEQKCFECEIVFKED